MTAAWNDNERWQRICEIFEAALGLTDASLDAYLAEVCAGDRDVEAEVRSLLESHRSAGDFLEGEGLLAVPDLETAALG